MNKAAPIHGIMAQFEDDEQLLNAARRAHAEGYRRMDAYSPFPVEGLAEALGHTGPSVSLFVLLGGIAGGVGGYFMQWYAAVISYPLNIGGRPLHSWPAFIPITFELTILSAGLTAIITMLALNRLPRLNHPVFNAEEFARASQDRFSLCIETADPMFDPTSTRRFLESLGPEKIMEVPA